MVENGNWKNLEKVRPLGGECFGEIFPAEDISKAAAVYNRVQTCTTMYKQKNRLKIGGKG